MKLRKVVCHISCFPLYVSLVILYSWHLTSYIFAEKSRFRPDGAHCNGDFESTVSRLEPKAVTWEGGVRPESVKVNADVTTEIQRCHDQVVEPTCGVIDLIGKFDNRPTYINRCSSNNADGLNNFKCPPQLELSLRRICPGSSNNQENGERPVLNHSNASAFSW